MPGAIGVPHPRNQIPAAIEDQNGNYLPGGLIQGDTLDHFINSGYHPTANGTILIEHRRPNP